jgi:hypothetical protein
MGAPDTTDLEQITANTKITDEVTTTSVEEKASEEATVADEAVIEVMTPEPKAE